MEVEVKPANSNERSNIRNGSKTNSDSNEKWKRKIKRTPIPTRGQILETENKTNSNERNNNSDSNENLLQTQSNGQNHAEHHSEKNMLNLEMVRKCRFEISLMKLIVQHNRGVPLTAERRGCWTDHTSKLLLMPTMMRKNTGCVDWVFFCPFGKVFFH